MLRINEYGKKQFEHQMNSDEPGDKKKFEIDLKYFTEWFQKNEKLIKKKYEFFYGPYSGNRQMIDNLRCRTIQTLDQNKTLKQTLQMHEIYQNSDPKLKRKDRAKRVKIIVNEANHNSSEGLMTTTKYLRELHEDDHEHDNAEEIPENYMNFQDKMDTYEAISKKFWGRLKDMICGPEHEYVILKRLVHKIREKMKQ